MIRRPFALPAGVLCALLVVPAAALGATRTGSTTDPGGDAEPQFDIRKTAVSYRTSGAVTAKISLAAVPQPGALIAAILSQRARSKKCLSDAPLALGYLPGSGKAFATMGNKALRARAKVKGARVTIFTRGPKVARKGWDCATSAAGPEDATIASDLLDRPVKLKLKRNRSFRGRRAG